MDRNNRYFIEALYRGLSILEVFSEEKSTLSLAEIASSVELDKSTVFRFVHTLEQLGYLERDPESKKYRPGIQVLKLGFTALNSMDIVQLARPYLKKLSAEIKETVNMSMRDGAEIVYIARFSPAQIVNISLHIGSRLPVHCTSMGKVQLINLQKEELGQLLGPEPYEAYTDKTLNTLDKLWAELVHVREKGFAINDEELAVGLCSVAAPIRRSNGHVIAAVNISVASARVPRDVIEQRLSGMVVDTANRISSALGAVN